jgi:hypothetical protein
LTIHNRESAASSLFARIGPWLAFSLALAAVMAYSDRLQPWTLDDAFISFRYAENFAEGKGLVYNPGEYVEGYTTFLWVILLGLGHYAGLNTVLLSKVLGVFFTAGVLALTASMHRFVPGADARTSTAATLMLGTCGIFTAWAMSGMEVAILAFWSVLAVFLHFRAGTSPRRNLLSAVSGVCCALAAMSRPEAGLIFGILFLDRLRDSWRTRNTSFLYFGAAFVLIYAPYFAWRYWYYGWLLPNTFYVKVGSSWAQAKRGYDYTIQFAIASLFLLAAGLAAAFGGRSRKDHPEGGGLLAAIFAAQTFYVIAVGGDCMPAFRFFAPVMPFLCMLAALFLTGWIHSSGRAVAVLLAIIAHNGSQMAMNDTLGHNLMGDRVWSRGRNTGLWFRDNVPPDSLLATNTAGSIPYYSRLATIDMLGLNDEHIAHRDIPTLGQGFPGHEKGDGKYVLSRKPDYVILGSASGSEKPGFRSDREMFADPEFKKWYQHKSCRVADGQTLHYYERRAAPLVQAPKPPAQTKR